jgi:2-phosphoglycerate kinase
MSVPEWDVLLVGAASGTGKTSISYRLAQQVGVGITEADDLHLVLETMTTPAQQPILHYWTTKPESVEMSAQEILDLHIAVCRVLAPALLAVISNHVEEGTAIILEGDYILPELLVQWREQVPTQVDRVRALFLHEPDERQIIRNFLQREPDEGEQQGRAHVSRLFDNWLHQECIRAKIPVVSPRPWATLIDRLLAMIGQTL